MSGRLRARGLAQAADLASKRKPPKFTDQDRDILLHRPVSRPPSLAPEPVDVSRAIGRPPMAWEAFLIIEARRRERRAELALFKGVGPS